MSKQTRTARSTKTEVFSGLSVKLFLTLVLVLLYLPMRIENFFNPVDDGVMLLMTAMVCLCAFLAVASVYSILHYTKKTEATGNVWWTFYPYVTHGCYWAGIVLLFVYGRTGWYWLMAPFVGLIPAYVMAAVCIRD